MTSPPSPVPPPPVPGPPPPRTPPFSVPVDLRDGSPAGALQVPFSVLDAMLAVLIYLVGQLVAGLVLAALAFVTEVPLAGPALLLAGLGGQVLGLSLVVGYLLARRRLTWRVLGPVRPGRRQIGLGVVVGVVGTVLAYGVNAGLVLLTGAQDPVEQEVLRELLAGGSAMLLAITMAVVVAPIAEELLFRGLLFAALRRRLGLWPAAIGSSAVFTAIHVEVVLSQPVALAGLLTLGVVLAWAFQRTGSLVVPVVAHAVFNALSVTFAVVADRVGAL